MIKKPEESTKDPPSIWDKSLFKNRATTAPTNNRTSRKRKSPQNYGTDSAKFIKISNEDHKSNSLEEWKISISPGIQNQFTPIPPTSIRPGLQQPEGHKKETKKRAHPFSARVHFKRSDAELSSITKDQRHSTHRRGIVMGQPEKIARELVNGYDEISDNIESYEQDQEYNPEISVSIENFDQLDGIEDFGTSRDSSPDNLSSGKSFVHSRASSSSMLFFSSGNDYIKESFSESPIIRQDSVTPSIEYKGYHPDPETPTIIGSTYPETPNFTIKTSREGYLNQNSKLLTVKNHLSNISSQESFDLGFRDSTRLLTASSEYSDKKDQKSPRLSRQGTAKSDVRSVSKENQEQMERIMIMEQEIAFLESRFQYFEAIKMMQKCLTLMYSTYGSWNHEKVQKYTERIVAACNTYANQYLHGFPISGITHVSAQDSVSEISQPDLLTAYSLLKVALHYSDEGSPIHFQNKSALLLLTWCNLTSYFRKTNNIQKAYRCSRKAYQYKKSRQGSKLKGEVKMIDNPAGIEINLGAILSAMGRHHDSLKYARLALNILLDEDLTIDDNQRWFPDNNTRRKIFSIYSSLVIVHHNIAVELEHLNRMDEARVWHEKALNIAKIRLGGQSELTLDMHKALNEFYQHERGDNLRDKEWSLLRTRTGFTPIEQFHLPKIFSSEQEQNDITKPITKISNLNILSTIDDPNPAEVSLQLSSTTNTTSLRKKSNDFSLVIVSEQDQKPAPPKSAKSNSFSRRFDSTQQSKLFSLSQTFATTNNSLTMKKKTISKTLKARYEVIQQIYVENKVPHPPSRSLGSSSSRRFKFGDQKGNIVKKAWGTPKNFNEHTHLGANGDDTIIDQALLRIKNQDLSVQNKAAIIIQNSWRIFLSKKEAKKRKDYICNFSALFIQSVFRGHRLRNQYYKFGFAILSLQTNFRRKYARNSFIQQKRAATIIQRIFKGWSLRGLMSQKQTAAVKIQQNFRKFSAQNHMIAKRKASIIIQTAWRVYSSRKLYNKLKKSSKLIQYHWRVHMNSKKAKQRFRLAVLVERAWRLYKQHKKQLKLFTNATKIQSTWKFYTVRKRFSELQNASLLIQPILRMIIDKTRFESLTKVTIMLQAKQKQILSERIFKREKDAAICISRHVRGYIVRKDIQKHHNAAIIIQRSVRYHNVRRNKNNKLAAIKIQTTWRAYMHRQQYFKMQKSAKTIQLMWKNSLACKEVQRMHKSQIRIARVWRGYYDRKILEKQQAAANKIQSSIRGYAQRRLIKAQHEGSRRIQTLFRSWLLRQRMRPFYHASTTISRIYRGYIIRKKIKKEQQSTMLIQRSVRLWLASLENKRRLQQIKREHSSITIQSWWRMIIVKIRLQRQNNAATIIQSQVYKLFAYNIIKKEKTAAIIIQKNWRVHHTGIINARRNQAAHRLQVWWRYQLWLKKLRAKNIAAARIQGFIRSLKTRQHLKKMNSFALKIQSVWLTYLQLKNIQRQHQAAIEIQRVWRSYASRIHQKQENEAAYIIQHAWFDYWDNIHELMEKLT